MSFNLLDSVKNIFNNDFLTKASHITGENENNIRTAITGIVPVVLTGLLHQTASGSSQTILNVAKDASQSGILGNLTGNLGNNQWISKGLDYVKNLFGDKTGNVTSLISSFSGIRESSASSLMSVAAPAALSVLGRHATETNMNANSMTSLLNEQKDNILHALPSGLNLAGALGLGSLTGIGTKLGSKLTEWKNIAGSEKLPPSTPVKKKLNWLPLVLGAIVVIGIIILLGKGCNGSNKEAVMVSSDTAHQDTSIVQPVSIARESIKVKLPDNTELDAYKGGIEDQLVTFLNNPASIPGKNVWFDFDNLNFTTGSAQITDASQVQVKNIDAILKAYPKLKIKIGGYTDKTGDSLSNLRLSQSRADALMNALKNGGADMKQIVGAEGYGSQFAKSDSGAPDEDRQKDRRISLSVRAK